MHEMGIALEIHRVCREAVADRGPGRIEKVRVAVGELSAIEPDLLRFAWEAVTRETTDEGAALEIEWHRTEQVCPSCGPVPDRAPGTWLRLCPSCGGPLELRGGTELEVLDLVFAAEDDPPGPGGDEPGEESA